MASKKRVTYMMTRGEEIKTLEVVDWLKSKFVDERKR